MNYYIGIDIGTTSTKTVAFSDTGSIIAKETISYTIQHPQANYSEQDPNVIFEAVVGGINQVTAKLIEHTPVLISFSAAMHSLLLMDANGAAITNCIIWADNRAGDIAEQFKTLPEGNDFYHRSGVPIHAMSPFCKLLWLKEYAENEFQRAHKFIGIKEYVFYRLFNNYTVDTPVASATGLLNAHTLEWDQTILAEIGISTAQLSAVVPPTHKEFLKKGSRYAGDTRLQKVLTTAFIAGGSDGALANLGSGATSKNAMAITIGTSSAVRMVTNEVYTDAQMRTFCYHLNHESYIIGGASNNGAVVWQWMKDNLLATTETHDQLFAQASTVEAGCKGLLFIPYILGERAPVWNSNAKGIFFGLDITHAKRHMLRAALEGVIYSVFSIGKILMEKNRVTEIHATGGFTQSPLWLQILCDMFNCTVYVSDAVESSAAGAVRIGMEAMGIAGEWTPKTTDTYQPDTTRHTAYTKQFERFERIYQLLKVEMTTVPDQSLAAFLHK